MDCEGKKSVFIAPIIPRQTLLAFVSVEHSWGIILPTKTNRREPAEHSTQGNSAFSGGFWNT